MNPKNNLRVFAAYLVGFFLIAAVLTAFIIIPQINEFAERQYQRDAKATLQIESEVLRRHVRNRAQTLKDLASYPVITNAVLLATAEDKNLLDLIDNFTISGQKTPLVLQDIIGGVIYRTTATSAGVYGSLNPIVGRLIEGKLAIGFELIPGKQGVLSYKLSVPILYEGSIEGVLSAEINVQMKDVFSPHLFQEKTAFILRQGSLMAETNLEQILLPEEFSQKLLDLDAELIFVRDQSNLIDDQNKLRNTILFVLLSAMGLSFAAFMVLGYRSFSAEDVRGAGFKKETLAFPIGMGSLGVAIAILASYFTLQDHKEHIHHEVKIQNNKQLHAIENRLTRKVNLMRMLSGLFEASDHVTRKEFEIFTTQILQTHDDIRALKWLPYVADASRLLFESHGRGAHVENFQIREMGKDGAVVRAERREGYYPVFYASPKPADGRVLGLDQASEIHRRQAIIEAQKKFALTTTGLLKPLLKPESQGEIIFFHPVLRTKEHNKLHFVGLVSGAFYIRDIVAKAQGAGVSNTHILIEDVTDHKNISCILCVSTLQPADPAVSTIRNVNIGERVWKISAFPKSNVVKPNSYTLPFIILVSGVFISFVVSYTFWQLVRRRQIVEAQVEERTTEVRELSEAMEKTLEGVSRIDPQGRYSFVNEAYASLCGYTPAELTGENWTKTVHEDDHENMNKEYQTMLKTGYVTAEPRGVRKDGTVFYKRVTMTSRYDDDGNFIGHHCFMTDISKRKEAEIELLRSNRDLDDFAHIASHDLKEPLRGIHNHAKLYMDDHAEALDEEGTHRLSRIIYLSQRMETLINDLLYYSRLGRQGTEFTLVDLNELVIQEQKLLADDRSVVITLTDKLPTIRCDKQRVAELLRNLIANAIKYNDKKLKMIAIGLEKDQNGQNHQIPIFYVKDNGIGIDPRFHKDIFKIFKRLHKKDAYGGGTGSGLTFAQKIVAQHKGEIWVESEPGKGSAFYFTLSKA